MTDQEKRIAAITIDFREAAQNAADTDEYIAAHLPRVLTSLASEREEEVRQEIYTDIASFAPIDAQKTRMLLEYLRALAPSDPTV